MNVLNIYDNEEDCLIDTLIVKDDCYDLLMSCEKCYQTKLYSDENDKLIHYEDFDKIVYVSNEYIEELFKNDKELMTYIKDNSNGNYGDFVYELQENGLYNFVKDILDYYDELVDIASYREFYI